MHNYSRITRLSVSAAAVGIVMFAYGCGDDRNVVAPRQVNSASGAATSFVGANPYFDSRVAATDALHPSGVRALQRTAWVGRIHRDGLADFAAKLRAGQTNVRAERCAMLASVISKYVPQTEAESGIRFTAHGKRDVVRNAVKSARPCAGYDPMSLWSTSSAASFEEGDDGLVSELGLSYGEMVINAVRGTNGYRPQVDNAVYGVLNQAVYAGLSQPDLDYIAGVGNESISSSQYWYEVEQSYGGTMPELDVDHQAMVIWGYVAIDALGCGLGAGSAAIGGENRVRALLGQCALIGLGSSAGAWLSIKML